MSRRPWMPMYWADYFEDTIDLAADQHGVYLIMLGLAWRRGDGALPNDMPWLRRAIAGSASDMHGNRFNRIVPDLLNRFFELGADGKWRNKRQTKEREKAEKLSEKQKEKTEKRWSNNKQNKDLGDAAAMPITTHTHTHTQHSKEDSRGVALRAPATDKVRGMRLAADWQPAATDIEAMQARGYSRQHLSAETEKFRNFWLAKAGAAARKVDWSRTWINWILNSKQNGGFNGARATGGARRPAGDDFFAGLAAVAQDIAGDGGVAGPAPEEVPLGRVNIDG